MESELSERELRHRRREILQEQTRLEEERTLRAEQLEGDKQRINAEITNIQTQRDRLLVMRRNQQRMTGKIHSHLDEIQYQTNRSDQRQNSHPEQNTALRTTNTHQHIQDNIETHRLQNVNDGSYIGYVEQQMSDRGSVRTNYDYSRERRRTKEHAIDISYETQLLDEKLTELNNQTRVNEDRGIQDATTVTDPVFESLLSESIYDERVDNKWKQSQETYVKEISLRQETEDTSREENVFGRVISDRNLNTSRPEPLTNHLGKVRNTIGLYGETPPRNKNPILYTEMSTNRMMDHKLDSGGGRRREDSDVLEHPRDKGRVLSQRGNDTLYADKRSDFDYKQFGQNVNRDYYQHEMSQHRANKIGDDTHAQVPLYEKTYQRDTHPYIGDTDIVRKNIKYYTEEPITGYPYRQQQVSVKEKEDVVRGELDNENKNPNDEYVVRECVVKQESDISHNMSERKRELQELIEIENIRHKQLKDDEERRLIELKSQKAMLEKLVNKEREINAREMKLKEAELRLEEKIRRCKITDLPAAKEEAAGINIDTFEDRLTKRQDELKKKETELKQKEQMLTKVEEMVGNDVKRKTIVQTKPEISSFSGSEPKLKNEANLEEWKTEIRCLCESKLYPKSLISQAIRQSLKGQAKKVLIHMSPTASPEEIVSRTEDIFGNLSSKQTIFTEFYTTEQKASESVAEWGLRLEEIMQLIETKRRMTVEERDDMLRDKFWRSLYSIEVKNATRNSFENGENFEILRRKARAEEHELKLAIERKQLNQVQHQSHTSNTETNILKQQTELLNTLMDKVADLERKLEEKSSYRERRAPLFGRQRGQPNKNPRNKPQDEERPRTRSGYENKPPTDRNRSQGNRYFYGKQQNQQGSN